MDLAPYFDQFLSNIALGEPQVSRIDSAATTVSQFIVDQYEISSNDVFLQGSYANHTAVEPVEGGEYDVDIVALCVGPDVTSDQALDNLEAHFLSDGRFRDRIKTKKPCVRLEYAEDEVGSFHVDVVPVRLNANGAPPLEAPRRREGWSGTAPSEYTNWCTTQGPLYSRTVMTFKRWRDEQQTVRTAVKSIVLQVLVSQCMPQIADDASRLTQTFQSMHANLVGSTSPPAVWNPVNPGENLAQRWTNESFSDFVSELGEAIEWTKTANAATDTVEAADAWRELLGDDFPVLAPSQLGLELLDYSHAQSPSDLGWAEGIDPRYAVSVSATMQRGKRGQTLRRLPHDGQTVFHGHKLHFTAHLKAPNHVDVWWQVANTGGHARSQGGLRGEIFKGRDLRGRATVQNENWESTSYTGSHLIRALLIRDKVVVSESAWFRVNIYAKGQPFRR